MDGLIWLLEARRTGAIERASLPGHEIHSVEDLGVPGKFNPALRVTAGRAARKPGVHLRTRFSFHLASVVKHSVTDRATHAEIGYLNSMLAANAAAGGSAEHAKRILDVVGSVSSLALLLPLLVLTCIAIRLSSPGPAIFTQSRVGKGGRLFRIYKFRTMYREQADPSGRAQTVKGDSRVTPLGGVLRRTNIDELPQLWNVLRGDMSLVGPRPHVPGMMAVGKPYDEFVEVYGLRHMVKPGITGLAQVRGWRGETNSVARARMRIVCDLTYIAHASIGFDVKLLLLTLMREAYSGSGI
jgi:polysaccharide biosynthesis protein PslA